MRNSKVKPKRFLPTFAPSYVDVIAVVHDKDGGQHLERLQINRIEHGGNCIKVYVNLTGR